MKRILFALLTIASAALFGAEQFQNGQKICFYGDSITAPGGGYVYNLQRFYTTRFPERKIQWFNRGLSGSNLTNSLKRLQADVIDLQPDVVTIMMGMNDVNIKLYNNNTPDKANAGKRAQALNDYETSYRKTIEILKEKTKAKIILITPTPYDQYSLNSDANLTDANSGLTAAAAITRKLAREYNLELVEFHQGLTNLLQQWPDRKINRLDRIHPDIIGHLIMTKLFLEAQNISPEVGNYTLDAKNERSFTINPAVLPYPVDNHYLEVEKIIPLSFNTETLKFTNLSPGRYGVRMNGVFIGNFEQSELETVISLTDYDTPEMAAAKSVSALIEKARAIAGEERCVAAVEFFTDLKTNGQVDIRDHEAVDQYQTESLKQNPNSYAEYQYRVYKSRRDNVAELHRQISELSAQAYATAKVSPLTIELIAPVENRGPVAEFSGKEGRVNLPSLSVWSANLSFKINSVPGLTRYNLLNKRINGNEWHLFASPSAGGEFTLGFYAWNQDNKMILEAVLRNDRVKANRTYHLSVEAADRGICRIWLDDLEILNVKIDDNIAKCNSKLQIGGDDPAVEISDIVFYDVPRSRQSQPKVAPQSLAAGANQ